MAHDPSDLRSPVPPPPVLPADDGSVPMVAPQRFARSCLATRVSDEAAWYLAGWMTPVVLAAGEALLTEGVRDGDLYLMLGGELEVTVGGDLVLGRVGRGDWLGEVGLLDGGPASATVRALGPCRLLRLERADLERAKVDDPACAAELLRALLVDLTERVRRCSAGLVQVEDGRWRLRSAEDGAALFELVVRVAA